MTATCAKLRTRPKGSAGTREDSQKAREAGLREARADSDDSSSEPVEPAVMPPGPDPETSLLPLSGSSDHGDLWIASIRVTDNPGLPDLNFDCPWTRVGEENDDQHHNANRIYQPSTIQEGGSKTSDLFIQFNLRIIHRFSSCVLIIASTSGSGLVGRGESTGLCSSLY